MPPKQVPCTDVPVRELLEQARRAVEVYTEWVSERTYHGPEDPRRDVVTCMVRLIVRGMRDGWADCTHVALLLAAMQEREFGVGLFEAGCIVRVVRGGHKSVLASTCGDYFKTGNRWVPFGDTAEAKKCIVDGAPNPDAWIGESDWPRIVWIEGSPLSLLFDALRTNIGLADELSKTFPVRLVPELIAAYGYCSGIDAIRPRFREPPRKRFADTPIGKAFAKRPTATHHVQAPARSPGQELDSRTA